MHRDAPLQRGHRSWDHRGDARRIDARAQHEGQRGQAELAGALRVCQVHLVVGRGCPVRLPRVGRHADNRDGRPHVAHARERDAPADRALARPSVVGHRLVDDRDVRSGRAVGSREIAAGEERQLHRPEIARLNDAVNGRRAFAGRGQRPAFDRVAKRPRIAGEGQVIDGAHRGHSGKARQTVSHAQEHRIARRGRGMRRSGERDVRDRQVVGAEPGFDCSQLQHGATHESRADQQHQRQRHLGRDEQAPHALAGGTLRWRPSSHPERRR